MLRKASKAVPEGNGPVPQKEELESGHLTSRDVNRLFVERFDRQLKIMDSFFDRMEDRLDKKLDEISEEVRKMDQHAWSMKLGSHVLPWRQTGPQTLRRLASARRAPQQQYK